MMAHMVFCTRNKKEMEGLDEPPFDSEFGQKIYKNVSKAAWAEWVDRQKMLLNEYRLQPWTPAAQQFLVEQMEEFFFGLRPALALTAILDRQKSAKGPAHRGAAAWRPMLLIEWKLPHCAAIRPLGAPNPMASRAEPKEGKAPL